ncbi:MAG: prepilin-type N-terminal cleavage/methylation domain-containing protein [Oscillospiraceae bacterium]|nr:prepilin-type N-terminal cleavage/methylation domain-containing protein [Oscillospiraceae bacterium]
MKKRIKGFTLIELVIVLALFSIVMFSILQLLDPVSKFFVRSSNYETTTACIDNIKRAIEGNLKYADRVRVYSGYEAFSGLGGSGESPMSGNLSSQVQDFWEYFFEDRELIDCEGSIYVMVFDNRPQNGGITGLSKLGDFTSQQRNSGKISLISIPFKRGEDIDLTNNNVSVVDWYVNQKMYGNYNYQFALGTSSDFVMTPTAEGEPESSEEATPTPESPVDPATVFNPTDCTVQISSFQVSRTSDGTELQVSTIPQRSFASFSMKNVLDATKKYASPTYDYKIVQNPNAAKRNGYSQDSTGQIDQQQYVIESTGSGEEAVPIKLVRYETLNSNSGAGVVDSFYFIFTQPESIYDGNVSDADYSKYLADVVSIYGS